nr:PQQ-binding-like beta-propeller repeat protein [uncultured Anaerobutyricum sp.]
MGALKTALAILPENKKGNKPIVPEQFYALNNALYSYKHDNLLYFRANRMQELKGRVEGEVKFNDKGTYCVAVDSNRYAYFFDGKTGKLLWRAESESLTGEKTGIYAAAPLDENTAALVTDTKLVIVDINRKHGQKIYDSHFETTYTNGEVNLFIVNKKAVLWDEGRISVIELKNGKELYCKEREDTVRENIEQVIADEKGEKIFIAVGGELESEKEDGTGNLVYSEKNKKSKAGIYCYILKSKKLERISTRATEKICLVNKNQIAAVQYTNYTYTSMFISETTYSLALYNINTGKRIWEQNELKENDTNVKADCQCFDIKQNNKKHQKILVFYFKNTVYCLDANTHKLLSQKAYEASITGIGQYDDTRLLLGLEDGSIYIYIGYDRDKMKDYSNWAISEMQAGKINSDFKIKHFSYDMRGVTALEYGEKKIIFLNLIEDNNVKFLDENEEIVFYKTVEQSGEKTVYRCIESNGFYTGENPRVVIYKCGENKPLYTISAENKNESIGGVTLGLRNGKVVICYIINPETDWKSVDKKKSIFYMVDLQTKKIIGRCKLPSNNYISDDSITYTNDLSYIWIWKWIHNDIWSICLTQNKLQLKKEKQWKFESRDNIKKIQCTKDNHYLVMLCSNYSSDETKYYLKIWDRTAQQYKEIDGKEKILNVEDENGFAVGKKKNLIAISQKDEVIRIVNIDKGKIDKVIDDYKNNEDTYISNNSMSFFCNDRYILRLRFGEDMLSMLDAGTGEILAEEKDNFIGDEIIVDDSTEYFGIKDNFIGRNTDEVRNQTLCIYMLNHENETFVKYADINRGWASFEGEEITGRSKGKKNNLIYYTDFYSFSQLKKQAEKLLDGEKLTAQEKRKYFLENQ